MKTQGKSMTPARGPQTYELFFALLRSKITFPNKTKQRDLNIAHPVVLTGRPRERPIKNYISEQNKTDSRKKPTS